MRVPSPLPGLLLPAVLCSASLALAQPPSASARPPDQILLKDYKPVSIHRAPLDEHFYAPIFEYHWSYSGFGLEDPVLQKLYRANALDVARRAAAGTRGQAR